MSSGARLPSSSAMSWSNFARSFSTELAMKQTIARKVDIEEKPKTTRPKGAVVRLRFETDAAGKISQMRWLSPELPHSFARSAQ